MKHFTWAEFTRSATAEREGIENSPGRSEMMAITLLVDNVLDPLREALGEPVHITSGYRSPALNAVIGGSKSSQHMRGEAADIRVTGLTGKEVLRRILALELPVDQAILYEAGHGKPELHVSHSADRPQRGELLKWTARRGYTAITPEEVESDGCS